MDPTTQHMVIVSNRLPVVIEGKQDEMTVKPGSGGLVTALAPILRNRGGVWIGWSGNENVEDEVRVKDLLKKSSNKVGFSLNSVSLSKEDVELFYHGFSNEIIWPLFHDLQSLCNFNPNYWNGYQKVNRIFAEEVSKTAGPQDFIWIHDYQLLLVGSELRKLDVNQSLGYFLHIPFPCLDMFLKLPWRFQILNALLEYDCIGFQTVRDQKNFINCLRHLHSHLVIKNEGGLHICYTATRAVRIGTFPISIDFDEFSDYASTQEVSDRAWHIHEKYPNQTLVFSLDRLDYSKGIPYRLEGIRSLLKNNPEIHGKVVFMQVVVPSRVQIPKYQALKEEIDKLVSEINSEFTTDAWIPISYMFRSLDRIELLSYYRTSEVLLVNSLKDGMNLVAKEYVASNIENSGLVVLSEFAGAAAQFQDAALLVNPYDIEGIAMALNTAINMPRDQRIKRMRKMRRNVRKYNIFWWLQYFLSAAIGKRLVDFPIIPEYVPTEAVEVVLN